MSEKIICDVVEDVKNSSFLRTLKATAEASCEEDLAPLFDLLDPLPSAVDMGSKFKETIGYNPITYYTEDAASRVFSDTYTLIQEADPANPHTKTIAALNAQQEDIINEMLGKTEATRDQRAYFGVKNRIRWILKDSGEMDSKTVNSIMDQLEARYNMNYRPRNNDAEEAHQNTSSNHQNFNKSDERSVNAFNQRNGDMSLPGGGKHPMQSTDTHEFDVDASELEIEEDELDTCEELAEDLMRDDDDEFTANYYDNTDDEDDDFAEDYYDDSDENYDDDDDYDGLPNIHHF